MMFVDPFRMMVVPPTAVAPHVMVIPIAIGDAPLRIYPHPLAMMVPHPTGVVLMPPIRVVPF
jgi:hypothetical protein